MKFEYEVVELKDGVGSSNQQPWKDLESVKATINAFGQKGWELTGATPRADLDGCTRSVVLWFKRPTA